MIKHLNKLSKATLFLSIIIWFVVVLMCGAHATDIVLYSTIYLFCILMSGEFIAQKVVFNNKKPVDNIAVSFILGNAFLFVNYIITDFLGLMRMAFVLPLAIGLNYFIHNRKEIKETISNGSAVLNFTISFSLIVFTLCAMLPLAHSDKLGYFYLHQDMMWSVGNAASVLHGFPIMDMRMNCSTLNYHYLNDVTSGIISMIVGQPAYDGLCFVWYPMIIMTLIPAIKQTAEKFTDSILIQSLLPITVLFGVGLDGITNYVTNMNGQGSATLVLCGGMCLLSDICEFDFKSLTNIQKIIRILIYIVVGFVISMYKSTIGALFCLAMTASVVVGLFTHKTNIHNTVYTICVSIGFGIAWYTIFRKAVNNLVFSGFDRIKYIPKNLLVYAKFGVIIYIISLVFSLVDFKKLSFSQLVTNAMFAGGLLAFHIYKHYSRSEVYFIYIAIPMMWFALSSTRGKLVQQKSLYKSIIFAGIILTDLITLKGLLPNARTGVQAFLRVINLREYGYSEEYISSDDYNAMIWLRDNSDVDSIFATNRNNKIFEASDGTFHYYSAVSERMSYIESYRYTMDYSGMYHEVRRRLEDISDNIFYNLDEEDAFSLARDEGIDYLIVWKMRNIPEWEEDPVYENESIKIYRVV